MPKTQYVDFKTVKSSVSILQILDHYLLTGTFKRNGDSLTGPCPLHGGQSPTQFRVSISKNCWNCFSECKHGGNILDFVSRKEGISIREAAIRISEWFGLSLEKPARNGESKSADEPKPTDESKPTAAPALRSTIKVAGISITLQPAIPQVRTARRERIRSQQLHPIERRMRGYSEVAGRCTAAFTEAESNLRRSAKSICVFSRSPVLRMTGGLELLHR